MGAARAEAGTSVEGSSPDAAARLDRLAGRLVATAAELEAARAAASDAAAGHQAELERLHGELLEARRALVAVQESLSWRLTRPVRGVGRLLRRRRR